MNDKKELAKKKSCHQVRFGTPSNFVTFSPLKNNNFSAVSCIKIDQLCTMSTLLRTTLWHLCVFWLIARGGSEYFVQLFEAWTWLVCMLACMRLCVTSQLFQLQATLSAIFQLFGAASVQVQLLLEGSLHAYMQCSESAKPVKVVRNI